jgi:phosphoribosylamine--glycine ligase
MIDKKGKVWPMEFTMRLGWPDFNIRQEVIQGDCVQWMKDLIDGKDTLKVSKHIAVGVVMAHGDFPHEHDQPDQWADFPIYGISDENFSHLHFQQVKKGKGFLWAGDKLARPSMTLTAGTYVMVVSGSGRTVAAAQKAAYDVAWGLKWPSNIVMRTDIGKRLEEQLPELQKHGFAEGMTYG